MIDSRESREQAAEIKFRVGPAVADRIRQWARTHLEADSHGSGPFGDEYETTTVYFDTQTFEVFHRRGSFGRAKYRIRRYADADVVFLERKLRRPGMLVKRRTPVPVAARAGLSRVNGSDTGRWFTRRLHARRLEPVCRLSYHRMARWLPDDPASPRLTLDAAVRASSVDVVRFDGEPGVPVLGRDQVLELKFRGPVPAVFKRLMSELVLRPETLSKYRAGVAALGLAGTDPEPPAHDDGARA
jgi:hypothetical protein